MGELRALGFVPPIMRVPYSIACCAWNVPYTINHGIHMDVDTHGLAGEALHENFGIFV